MSLLTKIRLALAAPFVMTVRNFPFKRGRGPLIRYIVIPLLPPPPASFDVTLPGGAVLSFYYKETLGQGFLLGGGFESAERSFVAGQLRAGDVAFDIGANVGLFTLLMAQSVGEKGKVYAFEAFHGNIQRLIENINRNSFANVNVTECALSDQDGSVNLNMASDSAYFSLMTPIGGKDVGSSIRVRSLKLDTAWEEMGRPHVAFIKLDVEGAEALVLQGAQKCLSVTRPVILVECFDKKVFEHIDGILRPLGYTYTQPDGFALHDWIFSRKAEPVKMSSRLV